MDVTMRRMEANRAIEVGRSKMEIMKFPLTSYESLREIMRMSMK